MVEKLKSLMKKKKKIFIVNNSKFKVIMTKLLLFIKFITCRFNEQALDLIIGKGNCTGYFFNCYLAVSWPTLGHTQRDSFTNQMFITVFELF